MRNHNQRCQQSGDMPNMLAAAISRRSKAESGYLKLLTRAVRTTRGVLHRTELPRKSTRCGLLGIAAVASTVGMATVQQPTANPSQPQLQSSSTESTSQLRIYNIPAEMVGPIGAQLQLRYHDASHVSVTTEPKTGQLMVMAPAAVHQEISTQVDALLRNASGKAGNKTNASGTLQRNYVLKNLSWRELEDAVKRLAGSDLVVSTERHGEIVNLQVPNPRGLRDIIQIDRRENLVSFIGSGPSISGWGQVVHTLDEGQADTNQNTHVVPLAPARPLAVKTAIRLVNATAQQNIAGGQIEAQVELGDEESATAMGTLDSLGSDSGLFGDVQIEFIEEIDLVIIRGSKRDVQRTLDVIDKIKEQAAKTQPEVEVYQLQNANAEAVATLVTDLYESIYEARQGTVSITALGQPNALLLIGRKEVIESVKSLVDKIDQPLKPGDQLKVIRLEHASSVDIEQRVREFFTQNPPDGEERRWLGNPRQSSSRLPHKQPHRSGFAARDGRSRATDRRVGRGGHDSRK